MYMYPHPGQRFSGQRDLARNAIAGDRVHHRLRRTGPAAQNSDLLLGQRAAGVWSSVSHRSTSPVRYPIATRRAGDRDSCRSMRITASGYLSAWTTYIFLPTPFGLS